MNYPVPNAALRHSNSREAIVSQGVELQANPGLGLRPALRAQVESSVEYDPAPEGHE